MLKMLFAIFFITVTGCATISDGPFELVGGRAIDYTRLAQLIENESTIEQALGLLGEPFSRVSQRGGVEIVEYRSEKRRESVERAMGVVRTRHSQTMHEVVVLTFREGVLARIQKSSSTTLQ